jgi:hypothetical protein
VLGFLNDVWRYNDDRDENAVISYKDLNIKFLASNSIHIMGEIRGRNIELTSEDVVIEGKVETLSIHRHKFL